MSTSSVHASARCKASLAGQGDLNMVFRAVNPLQALLPLLNLVPGAIGAALYYSVFADSLLSTVAATQRFTKALKWADGMDPLIIDLDGDGIETTSLSDSKAYFDVDGDLLPNVPVGSRVTMVSLSSIAMVTPVSTVSARCSVAAQAVALPNCPNMTAMATARSRLPI